MIETAKSLDSDEYEEEPRSMREILDELRRCHMVAEWQLPEGGRVSLEERITHLQSELEGIRQTREGESE